MRSKFPNSDLREILQRSGHALNSLAGSTFLISGSTGFIGSWLVKTLAYANNSQKLGINMVLPVRNLTAAELNLELKNDSNVTFIHANFAYQDTFTSPDVTHVVYASTPSQRKTGGDNVEYMERVSLNSFNALKELCALQSTPPVFCNLSSGAVYGRKQLNQGRAKEQYLSLDAHSCELNDYGKIKFELELEVEKLNNLGHIRGANPRLFAFAGPGLSLDAHFAVGNFIKNALSGERIHIKGNPNTQRSYLYPTDLIVWLLNLLVNPTINPTHIGSENLVSISHLAEKISEIFSSPGVSAGDDSAESSIYVPETSKTREYLNVSEEVSLDESLMRWKNWLTSQPRS
jgi:UDP-glucuronate decarboxylase